jgi:hypothetical protein
MLAISLNPLDWVSSAAGKIAGAASGAIFDQLTQWVEDGLAYVATETAGFLTDFGNANVGDETLTQLGGMFKWIALVTVVITLMLGSASSILGSQHPLSDVVREVPITLLMLAGWYGVVSLWIEATAAVTRVLLSDTLLSALQNGFVLDPGIGSFLRFFVALMLMIFLIIFFVEMLVLSHMLTLGAIIGPLAIALRPWPSLRNVSGRMVRNLVALTLSPPLAVASMAIALRTLNEGGNVSFKAALAALAGLVVSVLMPAMVGRFLPLDGQGGLGARGLIAAGAGAATLAVGAVATGGAAAGAAGAAGASGAPGALGPSTIGGGGGGGGAAQGAMRAGQATSAVMGSSNDG